MAQQTGVMRIIRVSMLVALVASTLHGVALAQAPSPDPNPTRLFFAPTARSLEKGKAYFGVYEVFVPFVQVGLTNRISIGGGTPLIWSGGLTERPLWFTPKIQVLRRPSLDAAVGVLHFFNIGDYNMGIAYGVVTKGSADSAVTAGAGYAYVRSGGGENKGAAPVLMVGGEQRVGPKLKLVTENYLFHDLAIVSGGVRFVSDNLSVDVGLFSPIGAGVFVAAPVVNFVRKF